MAHETAADRAHRMVRGAGYRSGGGVAAGKKTIAKAVHEHEAHDHKGEKPTKLRLRGGGKVDGEHAAARPDRRARGGHVGKPKVGSIKINIGKGASAGPDPQMAARAGMQQGMRAGAALGERAAAQRMAGGQRPAMGAPPPGMGAAPPGGMPPGARPPMGAMGPQGAPVGIKRGGTVKRRNAGGAA